MTPQDFKQSMLQAPAGPANPFAVAYLQLCQVSYLDPSQIPAAVANLPSIVTSGGIWKCEWGPAQNSDDSNLVFAASYSTGANVPPVFVAAVTRGTDVDISDGWGIVVQIWEDMDATFQVPLPWLPSDSPVRIASGTWDGLQDVESLTSNGQSIQQFLNDFLTTPANADPVLIVTGHSLGGCLTSVIAPWLQNQLSSTVPVLNMVPATFAAPTAGNAAFAQYFQSTFNYSLRAFNSLDIVPFAWANLDGIDDVYDPCTLKVPDVVYGGIVLYNGLLSLFGASYAQPATNQMPLTGSCQSKDDWFQEALYQHHTTTYMGLLGGTSIPGVTLPVQPPHPRSHSRLRERFGPTSELTIRKARA